MEKIDEFNKVIKIKKWILNNKYLSVLLLILTSLIFIAVFADYIAPFDPYLGDLKKGFIAPDNEHLFGTDKLGRDIFSRVLYGIRISLSISIVLILIILFFGTVLGTLAGYFGGIADKIIMRICDILISCPSMVLAIALAGIMGASIKNAMIAIFVVTISKYIRLTRSLVIQINESEYIKAARMSGSKDVNILIRHLLPNISKTLIVTASTDLGTIILELSALSFLGFGVPSPYPELGFMINEGRSYMLYAPWIVLFPGVTIFIIVSVFNLISDAINTP